jgi:hypothetical protein
LRRCEDTAEMLLEADARFSGETLRIGINRPEKTLDFPPNLLIARLEALTWLDVVARSRLHSCSPENLNPAPKGRKTISNASRTS